MQLLDATFVFAKRGKLRSNLDIAVTKNLYGRDKKNPGILTLDLTNYPSTVLLSPPVQCMKNVVRYNQIRHDQENLRDMQQKIKNYILMVIALARQHQVKFAPMLLSFNDRRNFRHDK